MPPVWGRSNDFTDDLWLEYDVWARTEGGSLQAHERRKATMRNEISAMANKIWPNGDNKVPDAYKQAIQEELGWDTWAPDGANISYPGQQVITTQGIWYDLGNVNQGFDNNGDLTPDYNAWLQPVGIAASFDSGCFRLVGSYGLLIVKRQGGQETLIPFKDQLYFENLPPDNTGVVGLVFYQYIALDGGCTAGLSPYQEVASGRNNEKFNADFGTSIPALTSAVIESTGTITKTAVPTQGLELPGPIAYTIEFSNPTEVPLGAPQYGLPIVIQDSIPEGTVYSGGAEADNTAPAGITYQVRYSTDNGASWTNNPPATLSDVTDLQWWLSDPLEPGEGGTVTFGVTAQTGFVFHNTAGIGLGNANPFATDDATTFAAGDNIISGTVFEDDGNNNANPNNFGNGQLDGGEEGIENVPVNLYILIDGDYVLWATTTTDGDGYYEFTDLPDAEYQIVVGELSNVTHPGWTDTTGTVIDVDLTGGGNSPGNNFGFAPALTLQKNLVGPDPALEDQLVMYTIDLNNQLPGDGTAVGDNCVYTFWSTPNQYVVGNNQWVAENTTVPELNGTRSSTIFNRANTQNIFTENFAVTVQPGNITKVEYLVAGFEVSGNIGSDVVGMSIRYDGTNPTHDGPEFDYTYMLNNGYVNQSSGFLVWDVTGIGTRANNWQWSHLTGTDTRLIFYTSKTGSGSAETAFIDALGFRVTTDQTCGGDSPSSTINPLPLTDTFNADQLEFVSAEPAQTSVTTDGDSPYANTGTIFWNNLGPLYAGGTETVTVTFRVKDGTHGQTLINTATVDNAFFSNGNPTNDAEDDAETTIERTARIGDFIWFNTDDPANGIPGVVVTLTPQTPVVINGVTYSTTNPLITTTDSEGQYLFIGLPDATYIVEVDESTLPGTGASNISDPDGTFDSTLQVVVSNGTVSSTGNSWCEDPNCELDADFGYEVTNTIMGTIWHDYNADALKQFANGELPLAGWTVTLSGDANATTTTDANGLYVFSDLPDGNYTITVTPPADYVQTAESTDGSSADVVSCATVHPCNDAVASITVEDGNIYAGFDFGYRQVGEHNISGTVYADWNGDGSQQEGSEPGFAGITVSLYSESGAFITYTVTGLTGVYTFTNLPDGNYTVVVNTDDLPPGYSQTEDYDEPGVCNICDSQATTVEIDGGSVNDVDFGYQPVGTGQIGNTVWVDLNGDGIQAGIQETGIPTVTVWLEIELNGTWTRVMTQTTDANGNYLFDNLPDGNYRVIVDTEAEEIPEGPGGFTFVPSTPITQTVTMSGGIVTEINGEPCTNCDLDVDFGFKPLAAIGDTIYWDANGNGEQDWNEEGIAGATVELINANLFSVIYNGIEYAPGAVMATAITADGTGDNPAGFYQFTGLPTGDANTPYYYTVEVTNVPGNPAQTADPDRDGVACDDNTFPNMPACDNQTTVTVYPGTNFMGADFGYQPSGVIGDRVWFDFNDTGIQDDNTVGIPGVVVTVTNTSNPTEFYTTTTDFDGYYSFANLGDGEWTVTFGTPDGMLSTSSDMANVLAGNGSVGLSATVEIDEGVVTHINSQECNNSCDLNIDSSFRYAGTNSLSGTICLDDASDVLGQCGDNQTSGVTGNQSALSNIPVYAYLWTGSEYQLVGVAQTNSNGDYLFEGLPSADFVEDGTYYAISTSAPFSGLSLTTNDADYNDDVVDIVTNTTLTGDLISAYQVIQGDFSADNTVIDNVDFAYLGSQLLNFGDLPASYNVTMLGENGARHIVPIDNGIWLGPNICTGLDGTPDEEALATGSGDLGCHDGIDFGWNYLETTSDNILWENGENGGTITATVTGGNGYLMAWVDWNGDGTFLNSWEYDDWTASELIINQAVGEGENVITFNIPEYADVTTGPLNIRFRLFAQPPLLPQFAYAGEAYNGEVEDYQISMGHPLAITLNTAQIVSLHNPVVLPMLLLLIIATLTGLAVHRRRRLQYN